MRTLLLFICCAASCLLNSNTIIAKQVDAEALSKLETGWQSFFDGVKKYKRCEFTFNSSKDTVLYKVSSEGRKCILIQELPDGSPIAITARNGDYSFILEANSTGKSHDLKVMSTNETEDSPNGPYAFAVQMAELFETGFLCFPNVVRAADIDWRDPDWGLTKLAEIEDGLWTLHFSPSKASFVDDGIGRHYGAIRNGQVVLDPARNWLPVRGTFETKVGPNDPKTYQQKVEWEYAEDASGDLVPTCLKFLYYGDNMTDFEPDSEVKYRSEYLDLTFSSDLQANEFMISRFGFDEPKQIRSNFNLTWILIGIGIALLVVGFITKRSMERSR